MSMDTAGLKELNNLLEINSKTFTIGLKWIATAITLFGAVCTALALDPLNIYLLNLGAILFAWWGFRIEDKAMIIVNCGLVLIYILGLVIRL